MHLEAVMPLEPQTHDHPYPALSRPRYEAGSYALVPVRRADMEPLRRWRNDQRHDLGQDEEIPFAEQVLFWSEMVAPGQATPEPARMLFALLLRERLAGVGELAGIDWFHRRARLEVVLETSRAGRTAICRTETLLAVRLLQRIAFGELGLRRLTATSTPRRRHHQALLEECGFRPEGRLREHLCLDGEWHDLVLHGILRADYTTKL